MSKRKLPPVTPGGPIQGMPIKSLTVGDWCPDDKALAPPEAVGLTLEIEWRRGANVNLTMRLKTPAAVDLLIQQLLRHKRSVWPDAH